MYSANGNFYKNSHIIENMRNNYVDTSSSATNTGKPDTNQELVYTYKFDDIETVGILKKDDEPSKIKIKDFGGQRNITNRMYIHKLLPILYDKKIQRELINNIYFDIKIQNKKIQNKIDIDFRIITNRHFNFNLNNKDNIVYMIKKSNTITPEIFQYNIKIKNKNNKNINNINFNIRINPNDDNDPIFVINGLKWAIENTLGITIK
jgi:hypothetical protein